MIDELELLVIECLQEQSGTFDDIAERVWKKAIARALRKAIEEGEVRHMGSTYYPTASPLS